MSTTREQIMVALEALIAPPGRFVTVSRRNTNPENLGPALTPALFITEHLDHWERSAGFNQRPKRTLTVMAIIYYDVGTDANAIPSSTINPLIDQIEADVAVIDNRMTNTQTLGGLVQSVTIDGESQRASGDRTGKGLAIIPLRILIP